MLDFKEKRKIKKFFYSKVTIVFMGLALIFFLNSTFGVYKKARIAHENRQVVSGELKDIQERRSSVLFNIDRLKTDRGVEGEIRERFGVVKSGEEMVVIVDSQSGKVESNDKSITGVSDLWRQFIGIFK